MKTEAEIRERLRGLLMQELHHRVAAAGRRLPQRCKFHHSQHLDGRKTVGGEPNANFNRVTNERHLPVIGLCGFGVSDPTTWLGNICEDAIDAQRCPMFEPIHTKSAILEEFELQLLTPGWAEVAMPEVAGLCWALDDVTAGRLPWWKRLMLWALRIRVEPVLTPSQAVVRMLGSGSSDSSELLHSLYDEAPSNVVDPGKTSGN